jgi:hypothetical protein
VGRVYAMGNIVCGVGGVTDHIVDCVIADAIELTMRPGLRKGGGGELDNGNRFSSSRAAVVLCK